ncbi:MAG: hypothetical protein AAFX39_12425 [Pseudomonadota bacterium]
MAKRSKAADGQRSIADVGSPWLTVAGTVYGQNINKKLFKIYITLFLGELSCFVIGRHVF